MGGKEVQDRGASEEGKVDGEEEPGCGGFERKSLQNSARRTDVAVELRIVDDILDTLRRTESARERQKGPKRERTSGKFIASLCSSLPLTRTPSGKTPSFCSCVRVPRWCW